MLTLSKLIKKQASTLVAVVVPLSNRKELTPDEEISLRHLIHYLGKYDKYFLMPKSLRFERPGFRIKRFDNKYFGSVEAHKKLLFSPEFYNSFNNYKYILIYHLDSLVFSDQLTEWCNMDYDLIGAPWIVHKDAPYSPDSIFAGKVGCAGFALRKVESFLKVMYSSNYYISPADYWEQYRAKTKLSQYLNIYKRILMHLKIINNARLEMSRHSSLSEEIFWADRANYYFPEFKIAPLEEALRFAFECVPRYCFEKNNHNLPFGCHAWQRYDKGFWDPYLLK
jgi:hypothetical protein